MWGKQNGWNYHQYAEWEALCFGHPYWPELRYGLPGEGECGYEEACAAALPRQRRRLRPGIFFLLGCAAALALLGLLGLL